MAGVELCIVQQESAMRSLKQSPQIAAFKTGAQMAVVRENQAEFLVVLKIDDEESYRNVEKVIDPLLDDSHVNRVDAEALDLGFLERSDASDQVLDIMNEDDVERLIAGSPPDKRKEVRQAIALLRSVRESLVGIVEGQSEILANTKQMGVRIDEIRRKVRAAIADSKDKLAGLGL